MNQEEQTQAEAPLWMDLVISVVLVSIGILLSRHIPEPLGPDVGCSVPYGTCFVSLLAAVPLQTLVVGFLCWLLWMHATCLLVAHIPVLAPIRSFIRIVGRRLMGVGFLLVGIMLVLVAVVQESLAASRPPW